MLRSVSTALCGCLVLQLLLLCAGEEESVDIIGEAAFNETVLQSPFVTLVEFHSGLCGSCKEFAPTWQELMWGPLLAGVKFVRADIDEGPNLDLAVAKNLLDDGVPCIVLYSDAHNPAGHIVMTGDHKLSTQALSDRILADLDLTRSAASKARFSRAGLLKVGMHEHADGVQHGNWMAELSRLFGSDL